MTQKPWTKEDVCTHIKTNTTEHAGMYSAVIVIAALYLKLYGELPKDTGLSGQQAEWAECLMVAFPEPEIKK